MKKVAATRKSGTKNSGHLKYAPESGGKLGIMIVTFLLFVKK